MADSGKFNPYLRAGTNILQRIAETVQDVPADISAYIAGGLAISYWLEGRRISLDLDVLFSHRIVLEQGLSSLFDDYSLAVKDNEADICHINTSINRSDIIKMVPYFHI